MIEMIGSKIFLDDNYELREYYTENGIVRALVSNECTHSLIYLDKDKRNLLAIDYFKYYNLPVDLNPAGTDYLMLGGGAISYPRYYLNNYKNKKIDIVEINSKCIEYSKKYFYLDELIDYANERLDIIIDDAIKYISYTNKKYDYVLIDLFNGRQAIKEIYEPESIINLNRVLKKNGVIVINYVIENNNDKEILKKIIKIASEYKIITNEKYFNFLNNIGNIIIVLSNNEIYIPNTYEYIDITNNVI